MIKHTVALPSLVVHAAKDRILCSENGRRQGKAESPPESGSSGHCGCRVRFKFPKREQQVARHMIADIG